MDALAVDRVVRGAIALPPPHPNGEIAGQALAHFGALLARDGEQLRLVIGGKLCHEAEVAVGAAFPPGGHRSAPQLHRRARAAAREFACSGRETLRRLAVCRQNSPADAEAAGNQRPAEDRRMHFGQRQPSGDLPPAAGDNAQRALPGAALHRAEPGRPVEGRCAPLGREPLDPRRLRRIVRIGQGQAVAGHDEGGVHAASGTAACASRLAISSIRPQANSCTSSRSFGAMRARLV